MRHDRVRSAAMIFLAVAGFGITRTANAADYTWNTTTAGELWSTAADWSVGGVPATVAPTSADAVWISQGNPVISASDTATAQYLIMGAAAGSTGSLTINGGTLTGLSASYNGAKIGSVAGSVGSVVQNGGTVTVPNVTNSWFFVGYNGTGSYALNGGTLNMNSGEFAIGKATGSTGIFKQTGGTLNSSSVVNIYGTEYRGNGVYEISGGDVNLTGQSYNIDFYDNATMRIKGGAANIHMSGTIIQAVTSGPNDSILEFVLDNSANHISTINSDSTAWRGQGALRASLDGGVLLSNASKYTLIRPKGYNTNKQFLSYPSGLWVTVVHNDSATSYYDLDISFAAGTNRGTLDANGTLAASFTGSSYGYVNLANIDTSKPLDVLVDVTGTGTLSNFTNALTAAGITWTSTTGDYNLKLTMDPSVAGSSNFAWDLRTIDAGLTVDKVSLVPEPATCALFGLSVLMGLGTRKRSRAK